MSDKFYIPTKPFDIIAAINRMGAATGSASGAMQQANCDYNGHGLSLSWNDYNSYWVGGYMWSGWNVFIRSANFQTALDACVTEWNRQGLGAALRVTVRSEEEADICRSNPLFKEGVEDVTKSDWWTWKHSRVNEAFRLRLRSGIANLIAAQTPDDFDALNYPSLYAKAA